MFLDTSAILVFILKEHKLKYALKLLFENASDILEVLLLVQNQFFLMSKDIEFPGI